MQLIILLHLQQLLTAAEGDLQTGDLVIYNAGMDPYEGCAIGGLAGITMAILRQREALIAAWCPAAPAHTSRLSGRWVCGSFPHQELVAMHTMSVTTLLSQA
jgi:hypothetical protein